MARGKSIYYEVTERQGNIQESVHLVDIDIGKKFSLWISHDRRLYGRYNIVRLRSMLFFGINNFDEMSFEIPYPASIPEGALISDITMLSRFNGSFDGCLLFSEPVDVSLFKLLHLKFPNFISQISDMHDFHTTFQDYTKSSLALISPLCRSTSDGHGRSLACLLTCSTVHHCDAVLACDAVQGGRVVKHVIDLMAMCALRRDGDRGRLAVEVVKVVLKCMEENSRLESEMMENEFIGKLRACLECLVDCICDRLMRYLINFVRGMQIQEMVSMGFNHLILNPLLIRRMTPQAKELMQDFISVYFRQLSTLPPFNRYLSKRLFLIEVF